MKKKHIIILLLSMAICLMGGCTSGEHSEGADENDLVLTDWGHSSYTAKGMCYISEGIAHFFDAETGNDIVLCSKPNCPHKRTTINTTIVCDAYLGFDASAPLMTKDGIYYITTREEDAGKWDGKYVVRNDLDGRNRKELTKLEGVQSIICSEFDNGYLAACYMNGMDLDKKEYYDDGAFSYGNKEKRESGVYLVNTVTGDIEFVDSFSEYYDSYCWKCAFYNDKLYYANSYKLKAINYSDYENPDDYYNAAYENTVIELYEYDIKTKTGKKIWEGRNFEDVKFIGYGYIAIDTGKETVFMKGGQEIARYSSEELLPAGCEQMYSNKYVYEDVIYMVNWDEGKVWSKDFETGTVRYIADGKLNGKGIQRINAVIGNWIYYTQESDGKLRYCVTEKEDFLSGDIDSARIMITKDAAIRGETDKNPQNEDSVMDETKGYATDNMDSKTYIENLLADDTDVEEPIENIGEDTIVWGLMRLGDDADRRAERINQKLKEDGYPYEILFQQLELDPENNSSSYMTQDYRKSMFKSGADVVYTGMPNVSTDKTAWDPAYEAIMKGKLLKLDDYLKGSKLYDMIPEEFWDSVRVNGCIYCIPNPVLNDFCFSIVFKKSAYTEDQLQSFDNTIEGLIPFISAENKLYYGNYRFLSMYRIHSNDYGIYYTENGFGILPDLEEYVNGLTVLNSMAQAGMVINPGIKGLEESKDEWSVAFCSDSDAPLFSDAEYYIRSYRGVLSPRFNSSIAIKASSHNPDGAFKMIELIMTDPEYANLAAYKESVILKDGLAYDTEKEDYVAGYRSRLQFGVNEIVYPDKDNYLTRFESIEAKKEYYANNFDTANLSWLDYPLEMLKLRNLAYDNEKIIFKKDFAERLKKWQQESEEIYETIQRIYQ
ncbi:MAG: hypothetical protein K6A45_04505 [Lachnospiraceae bacterium]|nr:hypothetical protein [Lachnospiraceae bacterium]